MGITVSWDDDERTIIRMRFVEEWSLADFRAAHLQALVLLTQVDHKVYVISDTLEAEELPLGILWQLRDLIGTRPRNWGGGIALTQNIIAKSVVDVLGRVYMSKHGQMLFVVNSQEQADAVIARLKQADQGL